MAYLQKSDYTLHISVDHLDAILTQAAQSSGLTEDAIRLEAELTAQAQIKAIIGAYFDVDTEFAIDAPAERNRMIKKCTIDLALYHIFHTVNPRDIPEMREKRYDECMNMLKAYRDGDVDLGLNELDVDADGEPDNRIINLESPQKFISKPFRDFNLFDNE